MKLTDTTRFASRLLILAVLIAVPFLRMVLAENYGVLNIEVAVAVLLITAAAAMLGALACTRLLFNAVVLVIAVLLSANALQTELLPDLRLRWILIGAVSAIAGAMLVLKHNFYPVLLLFIGAGFFVDLAKGAVNAWSKPASTRAAAQPQHHVVHIVLDEMLGLGAMPPDCSECVTGARLWKETLINAGFRVYPHAFSNYRNTRDSLSSLLNARILKRTGEFFDLDATGTQVPQMRENRYFDHFLSRGYAVRAYQSDYLLYSASGKIPNHTYRANNLKALHRTSLPWTARMRQLFTIYLQADQFWWGAWTRALPKHLHPEKLDIGPLAFEEMWPGAVLNDYRAATKNTLFFVHLLMPHYPYVYRADGSLRNPEEWNQHRKLEFSEDQLQNYRRRYSMYGEQMQFAATRMASFLNELKTGGLYASTTVVIHGDHGSRLRLITAAHQQHREQLGGVSKGKQNDFYDYPGEPDSRDLLNQFATLFAVKSPGQMPGAVDPEPGSVLYRLRQTFAFAPGAETPEQMNSAYLFHPDGSPKAISMSRAFMEINPSISTLEESTN